MEKSMRNTLSYRQNGDNKFLPKLAKEAELRGGKCLATVEAGYDSQYLFECRFEHTFYQTARRVLAGRGWCLECVRRRRLAEDQILV
jgi:hypothetical protein